MKQTRIAKENIYRLFASLLCRVCLSFVFYFRRQRNSLYAVFARKYKNQLNDAIYYKRIWRGKIVKKNVKEGEAKKLIAKW